MNTLHLDALRPGDQGRICGFYPNTDPSYRQQLLAMGLTPNTTFEVVRRAPFGDPVEIRVRHFHLSLRQPEARALKIQRVENDQ